MQLAPKLNAVALCLTFAAYTLFVPAGSSQTAKDAPTTKLTRILTVLATGNQLEYERFVEDAYSSKARAEYSVAQHAASLARIFTDTGGFESVRVAGETDRFVVGETRDRILGQRYCVALTRDLDGGSERIADFEAWAIPAAGPGLKTLTPTELAAQIDRAARAYARRDLFSGVVLLARHNRVFFESAYGLASPAYKAPMTTGTRLNVASIGKTFTGVAIAQLVAAGKLSYDDTVGKFLPDFPNADVRQRVTIRQLLAHTSGLGPKDYYQEPGWESARLRLRSVSDYLKLIGNPQVGVEPGKYYYSNTGYVILGAIIERVAGVTYYDYVREHIFKPAGMTRSFYHEFDHEDFDVAAPLTNLFAQGDSYLYQLGRTRNATFDLAAKGGPQGGAFVTARDLFQFQRAMRNGTLLTTAMMKEMTTPVGTPGAGAPGMTGQAREGLGIEVVTRNGHTFYGHTGGDLGVASLVYWYPDTGYTTIILSNRDPRAARVLANLTRALITRKTINGAAPPERTCRAPINR